MTLNLRDGKLSNLIHSVHCFKHRLRVPFCSFLLAFPTTAILLQWHHTFHLDHHLSLYLFSHFNAYTFLMLCLLIHQHVSNSDYRHKRSSNSCCLAFICSISWRASFKSLVRLFTPNPDAVEDEPTCFIERPNPLTKPNLVTITWVNMSMSLEGDSSEVVYSSIIFSYKNYKNYNQ